MTCQGILTESYTDREQQAILDWLTSVDYSPQQNDFIGRRQEGTGEWLVESDEFQHWENNKKCILFCPGIPGSGKTMIVSIVVDHLFKKFRNDPGIGYCIPVLQFPAAARAATNRSLLKPTKAIFPETTPSS